MTRELSSIDADDAVKSYQSGESVLKIARRLHIRSQAISDILKEQGITVRSFERTPLPADELATRYLAGESEKALAASYGVIRSTIRRYLIDAGVTPRGRSESMLMRMKRTSPEERKRLVAAAHDAVRGRVRSVDELSKAAKTRQERVLHTSPYEFILRDALLKRGIEPTLQLAIGPYNADLGAEPVAVEVHGGGWHAYGKHGVRAPERIRYLFDSGWNVIVVAVDASRFPLTDAAADEVTAFVEQSRRDPSFRRQYRVIRGDGQPSPAFGLDFDDDA